MTNSAIEEHTNTKQYPISHNLTPTKRLQPFLKRTVSLRHHALNIIIPDLPHSPLHLLRAPPGIIPPFVLLPNQPLRWRHKSPTPLGQPLIDRYRCQRPPYREAARGQPHFLLLNLRRRRGWELQRGDAHAALDEDRDWKIMIGMATAMQRFIARSQVLCEEAGMRTGHGDGFIDATRAHVFTGLEIEF